MKGRTRPFNVSSKRSISFLLLVDENARFYVTSKRCVLKSLPSLFLFFFFTLKPILGRNSLRTSSPNNENLFQLP
jgi:hypothetical protein